MKGVVFTEFMDHLERAYGPVLVDDVITSSGVETRGAYTSVGTYPCSELVRLISAMSSISGLGIPQIIRQFGEQLAVSFKRDHPQYYDNIGYFDFVEAVENRIHVDVLKLYPDAELPRFFTVSRSERKLVIDYLSARHLEELAYGLLLGTARHFDENVSISMQPIKRDEGTCIRFEIVRS
ncbi:MAG: heme NO-binding domain-containing protein [Hyphomonadaceae bacterium]